MDFNLAGHHPTYHWLSGFQKDSLNWLKKNLPYQYLGLVKCKSSDGAVLGCDFVGEVTELEDTVTRLNKGDNVASLIWGGES
ncbi:hypothetical protein N7453_011620 [Penicillium expansum]|nr:hypothetical protein N7453_011620 [Penicillium expansum]